MSLKVILCNTPPAYTTKMNNCVKGVLCGDKASDQHAVSMD